MSPFNKSGILYKHSMNKNPVIYRMPWPMCSTSTVLRSACNEMVHRNGISTNTDTHSNGEKRKCICRRHCFELIHSLHLTLLRFWTWHDDTRSVLHCVISTIIVKFIPVSEKLVSVALTGSSFVYQPRKFQCKKQKTLHRNYQPPVTLYWTNNHKKQNTDSRDI
jgi:hypothetical protein